MDTFAELETPVPVVDLDRLERNLDRMARYAVQHRLGLRPHIKTHKASRVAEEQVRRGAVGLTCATPRELEVMAGVSRDLLLAHPPVNPGKLARLMALPGDVGLRVALDSAQAVEMLAEAARAHDRPVGVLVELDLGMRRVGVAAPEDAVALARLVAARPPLVLAGVLFYPGHIRQPVAEQAPHLDRLNQDLARVLNALAKAGLPARIVSGGSTPTSWSAHQIESLTEFRPGTYVYNDRATVTTDACTRDDCALTVLATVVSTAVAGQAVVDSGSKALGREAREIADAGYGELLDHPEVTVKAMSEEHGLLDLSRTDWRPEVGEQVRVIPNHVCIVVHLNDLIVGIRGDRVVERWAVEARGR
ncbi:MAG TPA: alanine racemase [Gemmatimonadales bacterium]